MWIIEIIRRFRRIMVPFQKNDATKFLTDMHGSGQPFYCVIGGGSFKIDLYIYRGRHYEASILPSDWTQAVGVLMSWASRIDSECK